ncbi:MAG: LSU ribosomal protein L32p @ LSU ribosomal protein L32p, zinc-dependent, partial [uncultured Rubrobacteraceae bacterium]
GRTEEEDVASSQGSAQGAPRPQGTQARGMLELRPASRTAPGLHQLWLLQGPYRGRRRGHRV